MKFFSRFWLKKSKSRSQPTSACIRDSHDATHLVDVMKQRVDAKAAINGFSGLANVSNTASPRHQEWAEDLQIAQDETERIERERKLKAARRHSTGRGGLGNMAGSIYRIEETEHLNAQNEMIQRQRGLKEARRQSMGRGGLGNIVMTDPVYQEETEELIAQKANEMIQRQRELKAAKRQSIGRGGMGNIDQSQIAIQEYKRQPIPQHQEAIADKPNYLGRGSLGNIFRCINRGFRKPARAPLAFVKHEDSEEDFFGQ